MKAGRAALIALAVWGVALAAASFAGPGGQGGAMASQATSPKIEALTDAVRDARPKKLDEIISNFMARNRGAFPLIEDSLVTYVYRGKVALRVCVPSDLNRWDTNADKMERLGSADFYYRTLVLPMDARIDYKLHVDNVWTLDPLNSTTVRGGFGDNSAFAMPAYQEPWEIAANTAIEHGTLEAHDFASEVLGNGRRIQVYLPAGYRPRGVPGGVAGSFAGSYRVIFVQDGGEYITLGSMVNVLDNLIAHGAIPAVVGIFVDPVERNSEYWLNPAYGQMVVDELVPFIRDRYDVGRDPAKTAIMGASLGGEIAVMIALDHPEVFGKCGSQSGVVGLDEGHLIKAVSAGPRQAVDFYLDCGRFGDATDENRRMQEALAGQGYLFKYQEFNEGHSWGNWRAHIDDMLVFFWGTDAAR